MPAKPSDKPPAKQADCEAKGEVFVKAHKQKGAVVKSNCRKQPKKKSV